LAGGVRAPPAVFLPAYFWRDRSAGNFRSARKLTDPENIFIFFSGRGWAEDCRKKLPFGLNPKFAPFQQTVALQKSKKVTGNTAPYLLIYICLT
jgi:hypothetical protein